MPSALVLVFACLSFTLFAQTPPDGAPVRDAEAVKKIEAHDAKVYTPSASGLAALEFAFPMPAAALPGLVLDIGWKAPDAVTVVARVGDDAPEAAKKQMRLLADLINDPARPEGQEFRTNARGVVTQVVGESLAPGLVADDVALLGADKVKVVARSEGSKRRFKEQTFTFNEKGLVSKIEAGAPNGLTTVIEPTWVEKGTQWSQSKVTMTMGKETKSIVFDYVEVGGFRLIGKMTASDGRNAPETLELRNLKPTAKAAK